MKVDTLPFGIAPVPHPSFFTLLSMCLAVSENTKKLNQTFIKYVPQIQAYNIQQLHQIFESLNNNWEEENFQIVIYLIHLRSSFRKKHSKSSIISLSFIIYYTQKYLKLL